MGRSAPQRGDHLTKAQNETFLLFVIFLSKTGRPPKLREIADIRNITHQGVEQSLKILVKKGYLIESDRYVTRRFRLAPELHHIISDLDEDPEESE